VNGYGRGDQGAGTGALAPGRHTLRRPGPPFTILKAAIPTGLSFQARKLGSGRG